MATRRRVFLPAHSAAGRMVCYCLTLGRRDDWRGLSLVLRRLSPAERAELARAALAACEDDDLALIGGAFRC